jgi:hypothetical protein
MSSLASGLVVPIPTLLPETEMGEFPTVEVPLKTGIVFVVPLPVTVWAVALADANAKHKPSHMQTDLRIVPDPFVSIVCCSRSKAARTSPRVFARTGSAEDDTLVLPKLTQRGQNDCSKTCGVVNES